MKSVLKLTKYNKSLMEKIDINMKKIQDYYQYELGIKKDEKLFRLNYYFLIRDIIIFILLMVFIILYKLNSSEFSLNDGYDEKENFVVFMNDYFLYIFFILIFAFISFNILLVSRKIIILKAYKKILLILFNFLIYFIHYILFLYKYDYSEFNSRALADLEGFFIILFSINIFITIIIIIIILCGLCDTKKDDYDIKFFLKQFKGIYLNKYEYKLPSQFYDLNEKEKYAFIFEKENIKRCCYILNSNHINLINKINDIRNQYNLSPYKYSKFEKLPEFLINEKTELNLYPEKNAYKLNNYLYIFKYPKNEFQNLLNNNEILNIITNDLLNKIYIIEQNNFEFICFYSFNYIYEKFNYPLNKRNNNFPSNKNESKPEEIHINTLKRRNSINISDDDIHNTEDKFENINKGEKKMKI